MNLFAGFGGLVGLTTAPTSFGGVGLSTESASFASVLASLTQPTAGLDVASLPTPPTAAEPPVLGAVATADPVDETPGDIATTPLVDAGTLATETEAPRALDDPSSPVPWPRPRRESSQDPAADTVMAAFGPSSQPVHATPTGIEMPNVNAESAVNVDAAANPEPMEKAPAVLTVHPSAGAPVVESGPTAELRPTPGVNTAAPMDPAPAEISTAETAPTRNAAAVATTPRPIPAMDTSPATNSTTPPHPAPTADSAPAATPVVPAAEALAHAGVVPVTAPQQNDAPVRLATISELPGSEVPGSQIAGSEFPGRFDTESVRAAALESGRTPNPAASAFDPVADEVAEAPVRPAAAKASGRAAAPSGLPPVTPTGGQPSVAPPASILSAAHAQAVLRAAATTAAGNADQGSDAAANIDVAIQTSTPVAAMGPTLHSQLRDFASRVTRDAGLQTELVVDAETDGVVTAAREASAGSEFGHASAHGHTVEGIDSTVDVVPTAPERVFGERLRQAVVESIVEEGRARLLESARHHLTARAQVHPSHLGRVDIEIEQLDGDRIKILLQAANEDARAALDAQGQELMADLSRHGFDVDQFETRSGGFGEDAEGLDESVASIEDQRPRPTLRRHRGAVDLEA